MSESEALTKKVTAADMVRAFESARTKILESFRMAREAEADLAATFKLGGCAGFDVADSYGRVHFDRPEESIERIRREAWGCIVDRLEVRRAMSVARAKELDEQLKNGELPEITVESINRLGLGYLQQLDEMLAEAVEEVFDVLRPHEWTRGGGYKTNTQLEIGRRVVLDGWVERGWSGGFQIHHYREQHVRALENVFTAIDGKGQIAKTHRSVLADAIAAEKTGRGQTEYFAFKAHKKGTLHIEFRRLDLLKRFNAIAGGRRLRPGRDAA